MAKSLTFPLSSKCKGPAASGSLHRLLQHIVWTHLMVSLSKGTFFNLAASSWPKIISTISTAPGCTRFSIITCTFHGDSKLTLDEETNNFLSVCLIVLLLYCSKPRLLFRVAKYTSALLPKSHEWSSDASASVLFHAISAQIFLDGETYGWAHFSNSIIKPITKISL